MKRIGLKVQALAIACCVVQLAFAAPAVKKASFCGKLSTVEAKGALAEAMAPYRLSAYRYTDGTNTVQALSFAPKKRGGRKMPLLVYLPGNGEKGDLINQFGQRAIFDLVTSEAFQKRTPCHLLAISPPATAMTLSGGLPGSPNKLQRLMHDLTFEMVCRNSAQVDKTRVYLTGFSYGGAGVYALLQHYPGEFAAGMPIASLPPLEDYFNAKRPCNCWHFYNEGDYARSGMSTKGLEAYRDKTNAAGGDFRIGSYPTGGHDAWTTAWKEPEVWHWMFSKTSDGKPVPGMKVGSGSGQRQIDLSSVKCTASVRGRDASCGPERAADGLDDTSYRPEHAFTKKDWWMAEFPAPVVGKVEVFSGDREGNGRLKHAYVEVSANGRSWTRAGTFSNRNGNCSFVRKEKFTHLRVRSAEDAKAPFVLRRCTVTVASR